MSNTRRVRQAERVSRAPRTAGGILPGVLLRACRPKQWVKNVLVLAAPFAAGRIGEQEIAIAVAIAFVCFSLVASSIYLVNDVRDVEEDRRHPTKRFRPIAAGEVSPAVALAAAAILLAGGLALSLLADPMLTAVLGTYAVMSVSYSIWLKHEPVVDLIVIAGGFLLRAIAGGAAAEIRLSQWFLLVAGFGSLFMVAGKRYSEIHALGADAGTRASLERYSESYLRFVWSLSAGVMLTTYSIWAFEIHATHGGFNWTAVSIAPTVVGVLRYAVDIDRGAAGEPEEIVLRDRGLQFVGVIWVLLLALGVFGG